MLWMQCWVSHCTVLTLIALRHASLDGRNFRVTVPASLTFATGWGRCAARWTPWRLGIGVPHGPVAAPLIDRGFVRHAISPKQRDHRREGHGVAGAKDDRRDACGPGDGVHTGRHPFRRLRVTDPRLVGLRA